MPRLVVEEGKKRSIVELAQRSTVTFGRSLSNTVVIADTAASREHCELERRGREWWLLDLGSRNGTLLNGELVSAPAKLVPGDHMAIGLALITYVTNESDLGMEESTGLSSFARSLGPNEPSPSTEERALGIRSPVSEAASAIFVGIEAGIPFSEILAAIEKEVLSRALEDAKGNRSEAARRLKLSRPGFLKKMKRHGLE